MAWLFKTNKILKEYKRYRKVGRELHHKIIDSYLKEATIKKSARMLRLLQNGQLVLDNEDDLSVLMDFALYEIRQADGKNAVERYTKEEGGINAIERELLASMVKAQTGLFKVSRVLRDKRQIVLENLTGSEEQVVLTDINFSRMVRDDMVIFFRPIRMRRVTMTSGIAFVFSADLKQELLRGWKRLEGKGSTAQYAWFFRKSKHSGFETMFV